MIRRNFLTYAGAAAASGIAARGPAAGAPPAEWRNKQSGMAYRRLGRTGFMISEIVMGGNEISPARYEHVLEAVDRGLNYLDTAPAYGRGASEEGFAKVIKARSRERVFLNTKVSAWDGNRTALYRKIFDSLPAPEQQKLRTLVEDEIRRRGLIEYDHIGMYNASQPDQVRGAVLADLMEDRYGRRIDRRTNYYQIILDSVEESLRRLDTDYLDVVTCPHGASTRGELLNYPEIFEAFEKLKKEGKARHLSVSAHNNPGGVLEAALEAGPYSMAMVAYNIVNHQWVAKALELAGKGGLGVIAMKSARPVHDTRPGRTVDPVRTARIEAAVAGPWKIPQKAYLWNLRNPNLSAVIANMQDSAQVREDLALAGRSGALNA